MKIADITKKTFTSQKLHLLFQSFFLIDIGDYHSAVKSLFKLNELFEKNKRFWAHSPFDYLSALNGIIDSCLQLFVPINYQKHAVSLNPWI